MFRSVALGAGVLFLALSAPAFSSQDSVLIDKSRIPAEATLVSRRVRRSSPSGSENPKLNRIGTLNADYSGSGPLRTAETSTLRHELISSFKTKARVVPGATILALRDTGQGFPR